jgi:hypothetical protein
MRAARTILSAFIFAVTAAGSASAQTIFVEDFEMPFTANYATITSGQVLVTAYHSWAVTQNSVDLYRGSARPEAGVFDGAQAIDLTGSPGEGTLETTFTTIPGTTYELVFHYARNAFIDPGTANARVEIIGSTTLLEDSVFHDQSQYPFSQYVPYQGGFTADGTTATIRFTGQDPGVAGLTLDGISIAAVNPTAVGSRKSGSGDAILGAHPNPFNPAVTIDFKIAEAGGIDVRIYDARGALVRTLVDGERPVGTHTARWNGTDAHGRGVSSGVYFAVLTTARGVTTRKLVLLK